MRGETAVMQHALNDLIPDRSPGCRGTRAVLLVIALVLALAGCKEVVYHDLSERDVNEMIGVLAESGIDARKTPAEKGRYVLEVDSGELGNAIQVLKQNGYPKEDFTNIGEVFEKSGLLSSPVEERARFIFAMSQTVSETLSRIDGVLTARVNLVLPENNPFDKDLRPSSAAVFIKYDPAYDLRDLQPDIKLLVQKSIEGLTYDKITLVMLPAQSSSDTFPSGAVQAAGPAGMMAFGGTPLWIWLAGGCVVGGAGWLLGRKGRRYPDAMLRTRSELEADPVLGNEALREKVNQR